MHENLQRNWTHSNNILTKIFAGRERIPTFYRKNYWQEKPKEDLQRDRQIAFQNTLKSHNYNKKIFDKNREDYDLKINDLVYTENGNKLNRRKTDELKIGPFKILDKISNVNF